MRIGQSIMRAKGRETAERSEANVRTIQKSAVC